MKWSYIIPRLIFLLIIWAFFYFALDPLLKWGMIKSLENVFEAKVEIGKVKTSFFPPSFEIYNMKVGNSKEEYKNLFEFKTLKLKIMGKPLFEKKFIMEESSLTGLEFNTPRKTSCKIYIPKTEPPEFVKKIMAESQDFVLDRISQAKTDFSKNLNLEISNLESLKLIEEAKQKYEDEYKQLIEKADFSKYQERIKNIEAKYQKIKDEKNFIKQAKEIGELNKEINKLLKDFKEDKNNIEKLVSDTKDFYSKLEDAKKKDIEKVISMAKLPSLDKEKIASVLLGEDLISKAEKYWSISKTAVKYIPENPKRKIFQEKKKRGRVVHFLKENNYPRFLIKKLHLDGTLTPENPIEYTGEILNITNQPSLYPKPLTLYISGKKDNSALEVKLQAHLYKEPIQSELNFKYDGVAIKNLKFGNEKSFKIEIPQCLSFNKLELKTISENIDGIFKSEFKDVKMIPYANISYKPLKDSIENSLAKVNNFNLTVKIGGKFSKPDLKLDTDLVNIITDAFKKSFGQELENAKKQVKEKIDLAIKEQKEKLDNIIKAKKSELDSKLKLNQEKLESWQKDFSQKLTKSIKLPIK